MRRARPRPPTGLRDQEENEQEIDDDGLHGGLPETTATKDVHHSLEQRQEVGESDLVRPVGRGLRPARQSWPNRDATCRRLHRLMTNHGDVTAFITCTCMFAGHSSLYGQQWRVPNNASAGGRKTRNFDE